MGRRTAHSLGGVQYVAPEHDTVRRHLASDTHDPVERDDGGHVMTNWTPRAAAKLAFMVAQGKSPGECATELGMSVAGVCRAASRLDIHFRNVHSANIPHDKLHVFKAAADRRGITLFSLVFKILGVMGDEPNLIDAVLDDLDD